MSKTIKKAIKKTKEPKLRFAQGDNQSFPKWEEERLSNLAKLITRKNKNSNVSRVLTNSAVNGIVDQRDYFEKDIANKNNLDGYYIVGKGDYVYNPRVSTIAPVGPISKNKVGEGVMSPLYMVFRFLNIENDFYEQYFKTSHWYQYLRTVSNSGARHDRMSIAPTIFMNMPLPHPHPEEQQKIADCLFSIDELITAQNQKLDALKAHKKGLMQQLFPAEGESVPRVRFPEFGLTGEWDEVDILDIATMKARIGWQNLRKEEHLDGGTYFLVTGTDFKNNKIDWKNAKFVSYDRYI